MRLSGYRRIFNRFNRTMFLAFGLSCSLVSEVSAQPSMSPIRPDKERRITIETIPQKSCFIGDLDLMAFDMKLSKTAYFTLTLESIAGDSLSIAPTILDNEVLAGPQTVRIYIPKISEPKLLGLFICKDSNRSGSCKNKRIDSIVDVIRQYSKVNDPQLLDPAKNFPDRVFYFNALVASPEYLEIIEPYNKSENLAIDAVNKVAGIDHSGMTSFLKEAYNKINSVPFKQDEEKLQVILPKYDPSACKDLSAH